MHLHSERRAHSGHEYRAQQELFSAGSRAFAHKTLNTPRVRAVLLLCPPLLDGDTTRSAGRVPVQVRRQSDKALANGRGIESKEC